jgi:hypothetical protein
MEEFIDSSSLRVSLGGKWLVEARSWKSWKRESSGNVRVVLARFTGRGQIAKQVGYQVKKQVYTRTSI